MCKEECQGSCSMEGGNSCNCQGSECGSSCGHGSGCGSCGEGNSCSTQESCGEGNWAETKAYKYYYKAKKKLIMKKIMEKMEKADGKKIEALADAIIKYVEEQEETEEKEGKKTEALEDKFAEVF